MRLQSLGFGEFDGEDALRETLSMLAASSTPDGDRRLACKPFDSCTVRIKLGFDGEPEHVEASLDGPLQPVLLQSIRDTQAEAFTTLDGKPLSPISFRCYESPEDPAPLDIYLAELSGTADYLNHVDAEGEDVWTEKAGDKTQFQGYVVNIRQEVNRFTERKLQIASVWVPGLFLNLCVPGTLSVRTGDLVGGITSISGSLLSGSKPSSGN